MKKILRLFLVLMVCFMMNSMVMAKEVDHFKGEVGNNSEIKDDINLIKLEEISAQDIYYKIYFNSDIEDLSNYSKSDEIYVDIQKETDNTYICTLSNSGKSISILENLLNKNGNS